MVLFRLLSRNRRYIEAMISSDKVRRLVSHSVTETTNVGHQPRPERTRLASAQGMMNPVSGREMRLVSRKC